MNDIVLQHVGRMMRCLTINVEMINETTDTYSSVSDGHMRSNRMELFEPVQIALCGDGPSLAGRCNDDALIGIFLFLFAKFHV